MRVIARLAAGLLLAAVTGTASAQFTQYSRPGGGDFALARISTADLVTETMEEARWHWGKLAVEPWVGVREVAYNDNVGRTPDNAGEKVSDVSATVGAGLRAFLPGGAGLVWAAHALPQYIWWQELETRRHWGGRYGLGMFGGAGRTAVELSLSLEDETKFFSREFEDQVETETTLARVDFDFALGGGFSFYTEGSQRLLRYGEQQGELPALRTVDRDETVGRGMFRHRPREGFLLGLGAEYSQADFEEVGSVRDNSGTAPVFEAAYQGQHLNLVGDLVARSLAFENGREGLDYDELTGHAALILVTSPRLQPRVYWQRNLVYSFSEDWPYFTDDIAGLALDGYLTTALSLHFWVEAGDNEYEPLEAGGPARVDDLSAAGGELMWHFGPGQLILGGYRTEYDSNLPEFDRTVTIYRFGFVIGQRSISPWG